MCSQRESGASRRFHSKLWRTGCFAAGLLSKFVIVKRRRRDFGIPRQVNLLGNAGEVHLLLNELIRAVLARGLDENSVPAGLHVFSGIILAVPIDGVFTGRAGGARYRMYDVGAFLRLAQPVAAVPRSQIGKVARFPLPKRDGAYGKLVLVLDPDRQIRSARLPFEAGKFDLDALKPDLRAPAARDTFYAF